MQKRSDESRVFDKTVHLGLNSAELLLPSGHSPSLDLFESVRPLCNFSSQVETFSYGPMLKEALILDEGRKALKASSDFLVLK